MWPMSHRRYIFGRYQDLCIQAYNDMILRAISFLAWLREPTVSGPKHSNQPEPAQLRTFLGDPKPVPGTRDLILKCYPVYSSACFKKKVLVDSA